MGLDQCHMKTSWFREVMSVFWGIELNLVFLKDSVMSCSVFWGVCGLGMALGSVSIMGSFVFLFS